jgi:hypothetical protein
MSTIERTNYPRFPKRRKINKHELEQGDSLSNEDLAFIHAKTKTDISKFNLASQLKSFQALGYFVGVNKIPDEISEYILILNKKLGNIDEIRDREIFDE